MSFSLLWIIWANPLILIKAYVELLTASPIMKNEACLSNLRGWRCQPVEISNVLIKVGIEIEFKSLFIPKWIKARFHGAGWVRSSSSLYKQAITVERTNSTRWVVNTSFMIVPTVNKAKMVCFRFTILTLMLQITYQRLPPKAQAIRRIFAPNGTW